MFRPCRCRAIWLALLLLVCGTPRAPAVLYNSRFNKTCKYSAWNVSRALFEQGIDGGYAWIMPLESSHVVLDYAKPWQACFGPGEAADLQQLRSGQRLPCFWRTNQWGNIDFWEENACDILIRSNCYCFAVNKFTGSYCEPGLGSTGKALALPIKDCAGAVAGVLSDGGRPVDRAAVYGRRSQGGGHFIALAVKPAEDASDTGDFHFWRLDEDGSWSYKAGDTLSRNTYRNGSLLRDIELPDARGHYREFCGYFEVFPETHKLVGNSYYFSNLPARFKLWRDVRVVGHVATLDRISPAWLAAYRAYYADAGWEDGLPRPKEGLRVSLLHGDRGSSSGSSSSSGSGSGGALLGGFRRPPHTYSVRPPGLGLRDARAAGAAADARDGGSDVARPLLLRRRLLR